MTFNYVSHSMLEYFKTKIKAFAEACAAAVLGESTDASTANTVYGAKKKAEEVLGTSEDAKTANTVYGAKALADANKADVIGESTDASTANTIYGAKAYSDANKSDLIGTAQDAASADTIKGAKAYADQVAAAAITSAYKPGGSKTAAQIKSTASGEDLLVAANEGKVYNLSDDLTIAAGDKTRFTENAEASYPAGTNVVVVEATPANGNTPATYKFDAIPGIYNMVDISSSAIDGWFTSGE